MTMCRLTHVLTRACGVRAFVQKLCALSHDNADVCDGTAALQMRVMFGGPAEVVCADRLPSPVFAKPSLRANKVEVGNHPAGKGLVQPHLRLVGSLRSVAPANHPSRITGSNIGGGKVAILDGIGDTALKGASPNRRIVVGAALIVALKPCSNPCKAVEVGPRMDIPAQIGEEETVSLLLFS